MIKYLTPGVQDILGREPIFKYKALSINWPLNQPDATNQQLTVK